MGALPTLYAATVPDLPGGTFVGPGGRAEQRGHPKVVTAAGKAYDEAAWRRLWEVSEQLTGVHYEFARRAPRDATCAPTAPPRSSGRRATWSASASCRCSRRWRRGRSARGCRSARPDEPEPFADVLRDLDEVLLPGVTHWQHPRYFAYFATSSSEPAILAELLAATLNSIAILWRTSPAATELEGVVLDWVADLLGLPAGWHGHIEDTASTSTLAAIIAAREATGRERDRLLGAGALVGRQGGADARHAAAQGSGRRRVPDASRCAGRSVRCRRRRGYRRHDRGDRGRSGAGDRRRVRGEPGRGCTSTRRTPARRWSARSFAGRSTAVDRADSLVVNAHKWMLTPMDCSLLWTRRPDDFRRAFSLIPEYLRTPDAEDALSLSEYGPALGRRFRALKLWAVLRCYGRSGLQRHIRGGIELAAAFERWVAEADGWELCAPRRFSVVCFRLDRARTSATAGCWSGSTRRGEIFISHCVLNGRYVLRLAVGQMSTTEDDVRRAWDVLVREAANL